METSLDGIVGIRDFESFLDKEVVILLWEGKYIYGILRSYDQFNSVTIENAKECVFHKEFYAIQRSGVCVVRGENIVIIGTSIMNLKKFKKVSHDKIMQMIQEESKE